LSVKATRIGADGFVVTTLAVPAVAPRSTASAAVIRRVLPGVFVACAVAYLTMPLAEATGGRGPWALTKSVPVVIAALIAVKPWRNLRAGVLAAAAAVAVVALAVCLVTPPGWFGATRAAAYGLAAAAFVLVAAYARSCRRAALLATIVAAAGGVQFTWSFIAWWGGRQQSTPMVGTFYWHNQFAGFLLAPALIGLSLLMAHRAPWRGVGWAVAPLAVAGIVHSSSRAGMGILLGGWVLVGVAGACVRVDRAILIRWFAASVLAVGVTVAVSGPPFFSSSASPFAAAEARAGAGETATANSTFRLYVWRESVSVFEHDPLVGVGYGEGHSRWLAAIAAGP
jgi:O-Antigen ligase